jgi:hypothetical protein
MVSSAGTFSLRCCQLSVIRMSVPPAPVITLVTVVHRRNINVAAVIFFQITPVGVILIVIPLDLDTPNWIVEAAVIGMRVPPRPILRLRVASAD